MIVRKAAAIVGAGITGLSAAFELARSSPVLDFVVLEAGAAAGGNVFTLQADDCVLDAGPDAIPTHRTEAIELCHELNLSSRLVPVGSKRDLVLFARRDRLVGVPGLLGGSAWSRLAGLARAPLLSPAGRVRALLGIMRGSSSDRAGVHSAGERVRARFGREFHERLAEPFVAATLAADIDRLDESVLGTWKNRSAQDERSRPSLPRHAQPERRRGGTVLCTHDGRRPARPRSSSYGLVPRSGMGELVDALVAAVGTHRVLTNACVASVTPVQGETVHPVWQLRLHGETSIMVDHLLVATPARAAARMFQAAAPGLSRALAALSSGSVASVLLAFDCGLPVPEAVVMLLPRTENRTLLALTWVTNKCPHCAPPGRSVLRAFVGGARHPSLVDTLDDAQVLEIVWSDLKAYLDLPQPRWSHVVRFAEAIPIHTVGHRSDLERLHEEASRWPRLWFAGGAFGMGTGLASCVAMGRHAARAVLSSL